MKKILIIIMLSIILVSQDIKSLGSTNTIKDNLSSGLSTVKDGIKLIQDVEKEYKKAFEDIDKFSNNKLNDILSASGLNMCFKSDINIASLIKTKKYNFDICSNGKFTKQDICNGISSEFKNLGININQFTKQSKNDLEINLCEWLESSSKKTNLKNINLSDKSNNENQKKVLETSIGKTSQVNNDVHTAYVLKNLISDKTAQDKNLLDKNINSININYDTYQDYIKDIEKSYKQYLAIQTLIEPQNFLQNNSVQSKIQDAQTLSNKQEIKRDLIVEYKKLLEKYKKRKMQREKIKNFNKLNQIAYPTKQYINTLNNLEDKTKSIIKIQQQQMLLLDLKLNIDKDIQNKILKTKLILDNMILLSIQYKKDT